MTIHPQDGEEAMEWPVHARWEARAACRDADPNIFFPEKGATKAAVREAKAVCRACPVKAECLAGALERREMYGIWGGTTETDRRKLRPVAA